LNAVLQLFRGFAVTEEAIFNAALGKSDPAERSAFLKEACGSDAGLRERIEGLLSAHEDASDFLEGPAAAAVDDPDAGETRAFDGTPVVDASRTRTHDGSAPADSCTSELIAFLKPSTQPGSLGRLAHYEVQEVVGQGAFGIVMRAFDDRLHRVVAIKMLAPQLATNGTARARFTREARAGAAVRDEHVVNIYAVSDDDAALPYLVMEYVAGQTLQHKLDKEGPLPVTEILRIGGQIARGLAAAHATGHVHRDIKPANILLENGVERVKITDFGLARAVDDASISISGVVAGTPMYMSPEQAQGEHVDHRADLFSLGSVLYTLCTGHAPFRASGTMAVLRRVVEDTPRPIRETNPDIPQWLVDVVTKLHAKKPEERFQSAKEVADLLARYLSELQQNGSVNVPVIAPATVPASPRSRRRVAFVDLVLVCVALIGIGYYALTQHTGETGTPQPQLKPPEGASDEEGWFAAGQEIPGWGKVMDPDGDCRVQQKGSRVRIIVPAKDHNLNAVFKKYNAPLIVRVVQGDFRARVRVHPYPDVESRPAANTPIEAPPDRLDPFDVLIIKGNNVFDQHPIEGPYLIGADGTVDLGPRYGGLVKVSGLSLEKAQAVIENQVRVQAKNAEIQVTPGHSREMFQNQLRQPRLSGDLLLWRDERHFIRLGRAIGPGLEGGRALRNDVVDFRPVETLSMPIPPDLRKVQAATPSYLEIERRGNVVKTRTSTDGINWSPTYELPSLELPEAVHIGVAAVCTNNGSEFRVEYEGFEVTELPPNLPGNPVTPPQSSP
jgi:serine/threonine protein kinase